VALALGMTALPTASGHRRLLPWLLLAVVAVLFLLHADRRSFLGDDAYISFRYAGNWAAGEGPVFNPGERVEGYTNFLWVALLAGGIRLGVPPEALAPTLGTLAGLGVLALTAWIGLRRHGRGDLLAWLAPAALALHPSFAAWSTGGLETQLFSFLLLAAAARFLVERQGAARPRPWSAPLFALATLTRPEGALFAALAGVVAAADARRRRRPLAPLVAWGALYLVPVLAHLAWRRAYYGAWLPNTFRAKVPEAQWEQGFDYVVYFLTGTGVVWLLPLLAAAVLVRPGLRQALFAAWLAADAAYLVAVGGDFMEFRFLVPMLPYLFLLTADGVRRLAELAGRRHAMTGAAAVAGAASAGVLLVVALPLAGVPSFPPSWVAPPADFASVRTLRNYAAHRVVQGRALAMLIEAGLLPADLHVVTGAVGALPYLTGWPTLDHHGLTDAEVAASAPTYRRVAHRRNVSPAQIRRKGAEVVMLSHKLVEIDPRALPTMVETSRQWLETYNRRAEEPRDRLRLVCRQPLPGMWMIFGTHLDDAALDRRLGRLPPCPPLPEG
jgi:arabinofuranosyltransferase